MDAACIEESKGLRQREGKVRKMEPDRYNRQRRAPERRQGGQRMPSEYGRRRESPERYERARRERILARRRRQVRRQLMIIGCFFLILVIVVFSLCARAVRSIRNSRMEGRVAEALAETYEKSEVADDSGSGQKFAKWLMAQCTEEELQELSDFAEENDGALTEKQIYDVTGSTLHVLEDMRQGLLDDADTARKNGIWVLNEGGSAQEEAGQSGSGNTAAGKSGNQEKGAARITVAGDLCLAEDGFVLDHYDEVNDLEKCISPEILDITQSADVFFLNHEYAISDRGEPLEGKYYTFRAKPERMKLLEQMGTDLVSLANNHVYDYGPEAMLDTTDLLDEAGIAYVGGGRNIDEAERPAYFIVNGMKIGFVAASNAEKTKYTPAATEDSPGILEAYDTTEFNRVISQASEECDYLIAYIHWGPEDETQHTEEQTEEGTGFLESGADIVVGGHPHVLEGIGYIDGKPIVYSMGDFWFNDETKYTGLLNLDITYDGLKEMSFTPCLQTDYTTQYISDESEQREMFDYLEGLSDGVKIDDGGVITKASGGK